MTEKQNGYYEMGEEFKLKDYGNSIFKVVPFATCVTCEFSNDEYTCESMRCGRAAREDGIAAMFILYDDDSEDLDGADEN